MSIQSTKQLQQSEIFFVLFLILVMATVVLTESGIQKPPIIQLPEASGYRFRSGSAELSETFRSKLVAEIIPTLKVVADSFGVNIIEVIGHTDGQIVGSGDQVGNLDVLLEEVAHSKDGGSLGGLIPSSNSDLGMMRALAIIKFIHANAQEWINARQIEFRPYSAAQMLLPNGALAKADRNPDADRRRIEIRFTRKQGESE